MLRFLNLSQLMAADDFVHRLTFLPARFRNLICDAVEYELTGGEVGRKVWLLTR